jgi:hypothetical protein
MFRPTAGNPGQDLRVFAWPEAAAVRDSTNLMRSDTLRGAGATAGASCTAEELGGMANPCLARDFDVAPCKINHHCLQGLAQSLMPLRGTH